jgi:hypothetical protein
VPRLFAYARAHGSIQGFDGADVITREEFFKTKADVFVPAALENQITAQEAQWLDVKMISEGANGPTSPEGDAILEQKGIVVAPDILANAGGVTVSYFEWIQNKRSEFWERDEVEARLEKKMVRQFAKVMGYAKERKISTRIAAYEMAYRMQTSAPEAIDLSGESDATLKLYGVDKGKPSFARNCLLARRLIERGVRFVQLYHTNWDSHGGPGENLENDFEKVCREVDQGQAALVKDLKSRGLLDDTLVIWGGEFGRTPMGESREKTGRNHHIEATTMWLAGGGVKSGYILGETDELGFSPVADRVHVHDLHATILHLLGLDHKRLTFRFQGRDFRLTDVHGELVTKLLA